MRRIVVLACMTVVLATPGCDGDTAAQPTPAGTGGPAAGILAPADRARDTVGRLNDLQNRTEQQTGGDAYAP